MCTRPRTHVSQCVRAYLRRFKAIPRLGPGRVSRTRASLGGSNVIVDSSRARALQTEHGRTRAIAKRVYRNKRDKERNAIERGGSAAALSTTHLDRLLFSLGNRSLFGSDRPRAHGYTVRVTFITVIIVPWQVTKPFFFPFSPPLPLPLPPSPFPHLPPCRSLQ